MKQTIWEIIESRQNSSLYCGFDYRGNILKKTLSSVFYNEKKRAAILEFLDDILSTLVDQVKMIKKTYNFVIEKNYRDFN